MSEKLRPNIINKLMLNIYCARWNIQLKEFTARHVIVTESMSPGAL